MFAKASTFTFLFGLVFVFGSFNPERCRAASVPVANPGFETDVLGDGGLSLTITGWDTSLGGGDGVFNPTTSQYPAGVPGGQNVAYVNLSGNRVRQVLSSTLQADGLYTLQVEVGNRQDEAFAGYEVQFLAGGVVLARDDDSLNPASGEFLTATVTYTSTSSDPQLGQLLEIKLLAKGVQANFDDVRLSFDPGTPTDTCCSWVPGPDLNNARSDFPLVELSPGKLLAAGGIGFATSFQASAEVLDSGTGVWTSVSPMPSSHRGKYQGVLLLSGEVLIAGDDPHIGSHPHPRTAYRYDESSDTWEMTASAPTIDRFLATMTLLPDGRVLHAGGYSGHSTGPTYSTADVYDPGTDSWTATGTMAEVRTGHTATLLITGPHAGEILVAGGGDRSPNNDATTGCELYDAATGTWSATGSLNESRSVHTATLLPSGQVLVTGGQHTLGSDGRDSAELYDPHTGTWTLAAPMTTPRLVHSATLLPSQKVLVAGGQTAFGATELDTVEIYDPASNSWSPGASMTTPRTRHSAALLPDGRVIVVGGIFNGDVLSSTETAKLDGIFFDGFESGDTSAWSDPDPVP